ncbi:MAG: thioredoxin family protein [Bacteroidota bacterium]|nr:thioredoxin family protein [Bacteroidota bacterium]
MKNISNSIILILISLFFAGKSHGQVQDTSIITLKGYNKLVANEKKLVLVYFSADWCSVCARVKPVIEKMAKQDSLKLKVLKIDTDRDKELTEEFEIDALPVLMIYRNGCREWLNIGIINENELKYIVDHFLKGK